MFPRHLHFRLTSVFCHCRLVDTTIASVRACFNSASGILRAASATDWNGTYQEHRIYPPLFLLQIDCGACWRLHGSRFALNDRPTVALPTEANIIHAVKNKFSMRNASFFSYLSAQRDNNQRISFVHGSLSDYFSSRPVICYQLILRFPSSRSRLDLAKGKFTNGLRPNFGYDGVGIQSDAARPLQLHSKIIPCRNFCMSRVLRWNPNKVRRC